LEITHQKRYPNAPARESIRPGLFAPWERPPNITIPPSNIGEAAHNTTLEGTRNNPRHMCIYTDGSEIEGRVGAAAYSLKDRTYKARSLGSNQIANVYAGELLAIALALDLVQEKCSETAEARDYPREVTIFSDSQAGLKAIRKPGNKSGQSLILSIRIRLRTTQRLGIKVQLQWVPAHIGIFGNERADKLAKLATGWRDERGHIRPAPLWEHNRQLNAAANRTEKQLVKKAWQDAWSKGKTGKELRKLLPAINKKSLDIYKGIPKALCAVLVQARTGKIALKAYLHAINRAEDNRCECGEIQTLQHVLLTCPKFEKLRQEVWKDRTSRHTDAKLMLSEPTETYKVAKFLIKTGLLGQFARATDKIQ
jgi:ribonuclease HI